MVGATNEAQEVSFGKILEPYVADPTSVFVISSDFCHWGERFSYTFYLPSSSSAASEGINLRSRPSGQSIHESIGRLDQLSMDAIHSGKYSAFIENLSTTGNTVCGRHPIGVMMSALEQYRAAKGADVGIFKFVRYERSSDAVRLSDSSVSYASAFAVF